MEKYIPRNDRSFTAFQWVAPFNHPEVCNIGHAGSKICRSCECQMDIHGLVLDIDDISKYAVCPGQWIVRNHFGAVFIMDDEHFKNAFELR
jgi:hypothetical protein